MHKKIIGFILAGVMALALPSLADDDDDEPKIRLRGLERVIEKLESFELPEIESVREHPQSLFVGPHGEVRIISGEVTSLVSSTMNVKVSGLTLAVNIGSARFLPDGSSASSLQVGTKVNVRGTINQSTGVITASTVHIRSPRPSLEDELMRKIQELIQRIREIQARLGLPLTPLPTPAPPPPPADTTAPVISSVLANNIASTSARIRWATNENADSTVWYSTTTPVTTASPTPSVFSSSLVTSHELNLTGLMASTTHYYVVRSKDAANNSATSAEFSFTTLP